MTAQIIPFRTKQTTSKYLPMPASYEELTSVLTDVFQLHCELFGYPEELLYAQHVTPFSDERYPGLLLLDVDTPAHERGLFCIERETFALQKLLDRPLVHCR